MKNKVEVMEMLVDSIPGCFISVDGKEMRFPLEDGREVKAVFTQAKEALGQKPEFSDTPTQVEQDQLASLLSALQI